jgi:hypothetical protein
MKIANNQNKHKKKVIGLMVLLFVMPLSNPIAQTINSAIINQWQDSRYTVHHNGTVTDTHTGLMWKVCSEGQTWWSESSGMPACLGSANTYTWKQALEIVNNLTFAGHNDWRVPNRNELISLTAEDRYSPSINSNIFLATPSKNFWSSSPSHSAINGGYAWIVNFEYGNDNSGDRGNGYHVRMVRASQ